MNRLTKSTDLLPCLAIWSVLALVYMTGATVALLFDDMGGMLFFTALTMGSLVAIASIPRWQSRERHCSHPVRRRSRRQSI